LVPSPDSLSFTSIVEVFPPSFGADEGKEPVIGLGQKTRDFIERVRRISHLADAILVADVKDTSRLKISPVHSASLIIRDVGVEAIPVITARDSNRPAVLSSILTAFSLGVRSLMLVWGDRYDERDGAKNVYDFTSLADLILSAKKIAKRAGIDCSVFAPVDLSSLEREKGLAIARKRLESGADMLLSQPPTADSTTTLRKHIAVLDKAGLSRSVILNVFPFRDAQDIEACRSKFGWELPQKLDSIASKGESELLREAKRVAQRIRSAGFPGVYVSTRGRPELARFILD
jgi:5,10-methylenetetrahydrofolate reductase